MASFMDGITGQVYLEPDVRDNVKTFANKRLLNNQMKYGYLKGYFQTRVFPQIVEKELRQEFIFAIENDKKIKILAQNFRDNNIVSVHIRRGDYLQILICLGIFV